MPVPDTSGVPPFADFEMLKNKLNEIVQKYNNLLVNMDSLNVVSLTADHIDSGTINAGVVTVRADYASGAYVEIGPTGMKIFDGSKFTFNVDISGNVTMTGATVQSTTGYPKVVMDPTGNLLQAAQDANRYLLVSPFNGTAPVVQLIDEIQAKSLLMYVSPLGNGSIITSVGDLQIGAGGSTLKLSGGNVQINGANCNVSKVVYVSSTSGGPANTPMIITNGIVTG